MQSWQWKGLLFFLFYLSPLRYTLSLQLILILFCFCGNSFALQLEMVMLQLEQDCDVDRAFRRLFAPGGVIQRDFGPQASRLDTSQFKEHATRYLQIFQPESGLSILPDKRYAGDRVDGRLVGGKIVVTKPFAKDSQISSLQGCIAEITLEEEPVMLRPVSLSLSLSLSLAFRREQWWWWLRGRQDLPAEPQHAMSTRRLGTFFRFMLTCANPVAMTIFSPTLPLFSLTGLARMTFPSCSQTVAIVRSSGSVLLLTLITTATQPANLQPKGCRWVIK